MRGTIRPDAGVIPRPFEGSIAVRLLTTIMLLSIPATVCAADAAPDATIVVTANRTPEPLSRIGQSVTVLDADTIATRQAQTVVDLLRTTPGVTIARNGGIGNSASVFIRGAESDQTVTLIDGIKLNDPSAPGGGFDFGNLMIGNISRIEILRGPQSVLWGSQAIGGVVNMITTPPTDRPTVNARGEYGWRDTANLVGNVAGKAGPLSASIGGGWFRTDGISAFNARRGGTERDGYRNYGANANLNLALTDAISVDARGWYSDGRVGIDGFAPPSFAFGDTAEVSRTKEFVGYTGLNAALFGGRFRNRIGYAYTDTDRRNTDTGSETFAGKGRNERLEYQGVLAIADGWQGIIGVEQETSRFTSASFGTETRGRARTRSVYGLLVATPVTGFTATGGLRHDDHDIFGGNTTVGASGVYTPNDGVTTLRASYSEGFKAPTLYQLQSEYGNGRLRPETATGWDAGLTQRLLDGAIEASAIWFHRDSRNLITFISCNIPTGICTDRPFGTYDNVARARAQGLEVGLALRPVAALRVQANYTYLDAENRSDGSAYGRSLTRRPKHSITTAIDYDWAFGLSTGGTLTHVGASFDDAANTRKVAGYVLADVRAAVPITPQIALYGRVENIFDARYETIFRYGTPGRAGYAGVRLRY